MKFLKNANVKTLVFSRILLDIYQDMSKSSRHLPTKQRTLVNTKLLDFA